MNQMLQTLWNAFCGGGLLSIGFIALSLIQWWWVVRGWIGLKAPSLIPFLGGVIGSLAIYVSGVPGAMKLLWVPFAIDPGSLLMLLNALYRAFLEKKR